LIHDDENGDITEIHGDNHRRLLNFIWDNNRNKSEQRTEQQKKFPWIGSWSHGNTNITITEKYVTRSNISNDYVFITPNVLQTFWCGHQTCFVLADDGESFTEVHGDNRWKLLKLQWKHIAPFEAVRYLSPSFQKAAAEIVCCFTENGIPVELVYIIVGMVIQLHYLQ